MAGYKEPGFAERVALATRARDKALEKLRSRPVADPAELARRAEAQAAKEAAAVEKRAAARAEREAAAAAKIENERMAIEGDAAAKEAAEAEAKAALDARYAARKRRNG